MNLYTLIRPLLFSLDAEKAHDYTLKTIQWMSKLGVLRLFAPQVNDVNPVEIMGIRFPNAVGLAAGLDKNGTYIDALATLGFGFIEIGTVTPRPQPGNPKPRLFRIVEAQGIINRFGFNNLGVDALIENVQASQYRGVLGINIGKNFDTPNEQALEDYLICFRKVYRYASYITINISSPNTKNLRALQEKENLSSLLATLKTEQAVQTQIHGKYVPIALKIAPDLNIDQLTSIANLLKLHKFDGVIATNTTLDRAQIKDMPYAEETGGLSGAPVREKSTWVISELAKQLNGEIAIIGVGGILSGEDARKKIAAGANLIQIYSGLIYKGPELVTETLQALT